MTKTEKTLFTRAVEAEMNKRMAQPAYQKYADNDRVIASVRRSVENYVREREERE